MTTRSEQTPDYGVGIPTSILQYHPEAARAFQQAFPDELLRFEEARFSNKMPLYLVGSAHKALLVTWLNGDAIKDNFFDMTMFGNALSAYPDIAGRNVEELGVFLPFVDARQDRRTRHPIPDTSDLAIVKSQYVFTQALAETMKHVMRAQYVMTLDLHSFHAARCFEQAGLELIDVSAMRLFADELIKRELLNDRLETIVSTTDLGDLNRAYCMSQCLDVPLAVVDKTRIVHGVGTESSIHQSLLYGNVENKRVVLVDDMISSGKTGLEAVKLLTSLGAAEIIFCATHPVCVGDYYDVLRIMLTNKKVTCMMTTNSLTFTPTPWRNVSPPYIGKQEKQLEVLDITPFLAYAAQVVITAPDRTTAKQTLAPYLLEIRNPYHLFTEITGILLEEPADTAIYRSGGIFEDIDRLDYSDNPISRCFPY